MSDSEDPIDPIEEVDEGEDDLFGDDDDQPQSPQARILDDDDLASDPEGESYPRYRDNDDQQEIKSKLVVGVRTYRHRIPTSNDNALRVLRVPKFVSFQPEVYDPETFQPSTFDIENATSETSKHVARVQRDPETGELKSNANIFKWSDGSVTISIGGEHYDMQKKPLAPAPGQPYAELRDGHYYAAAAEISSNLLITVGHITEQYTVRPNASVADDALTMLAERMAEANKGRKPADMIIRTTQDPELQKKQAEAAEKELAKAQRRRENAAAKMDGGLGRPGRGGLSIGDLEGGRRAGGTRKRGAAGGGKAARRRPEYDSDDDLPQGVGRHEAYDLDDGFLVGSDQEDEVSEDQDDDEEEEDVLDDDEEAPRRKRQRTAEVSDEDAEGDDVEPAAEASARARRRNVIDDDDEE